jgi:two-component system phosphate regulon response regulator OmpR
MTALPVSQILVVDDDTRLLDLLRRYLTEQGFRVTVAADAAAARTHVANLVFDLIVLDVMMPGETGIEFLRDLRTRSTVPVLLLTAMSDVDDRIHGLESGADDYLGKPFEPRELVLRMRTILKRVAVPPPVPTKVRLGEILFEPGKQQLRRGLTVIRLTQAESALLTVFAERPGMTLTRDDLTEAGVAAGQGRTIDVQVTRLRRKIEPDPKYPRYLQTVRGKGYVLHPD